MYSGARVRSVIPSASLPRPIGDAPLSALSARLFGALLAFVFLLASLPTVASAAITGQIVGTVVDSSQRPVAGATVAAASPTAVVHGVTDARGAFALIGVSADTYVVSVEKAGFSSSLSTGVTVIDDATETLHIVLNAASLKTIATSQARSSNAAFQRGAAETQYNISGAALETVQGKAFNDDEKSLLARLPSVTLDKNSTISIRGGTNFQTGYQFEGIDLTTPNSNLQNPNQNIGNFNLLTGFGAVQIIPGGGDATHGDTGTGLVSITAKRGTYPAFATLDLEDQSTPVKNQQYAFEFGVATKNNSVSNFVAIQKNDQYFQYGASGTNGASIGYYYPGANDPGTGVGVYNTAFNQQSNQFIDNLFVKFGKDQKQQFQFFVQNQIVRQGLGYNGFASTPYLSGSDPLAALYLSTGVVNQSQVSSLVPLFPGQTSPVQLLGSEDSISSPFTAYKLEYSNTFKNSFVTARFYQTFNNQSLQEPGQGVLVPENGGIRTAGALELNTQIGTRHFVQVGAKYEFVRPFGTIDQFADTPEFTTTGNYIGQRVGLPNAAVPTGFGFLPAVDFLPAAACPAQPSSNGGTNSNPPGTVPIGYVPSISAINCGYIGDRPGFAGARLPYEEDNPLTSQQVYGLFAQDTFSIGQSLKVQAGMRLDGYNFLYPNDPTNPPTIATLRHQRLFEPHFAITETIGRNDILRGTFGRTLSIPLPGLAGNYVNRGPYAAFAGIPSYDNFKGPFNATNPAATAATYCGLNAMTFCKDYADQLYWLARDGKFGTGTLGTPVRGATFTNFDLTYQHQFPQNVALSVTPFYRRGYDIVERSNDVTSQDFTSGVQQLGPPIESNLGVQKTTGVELLLSRSQEYGLSGQLSATYVNQLGNDPPGSYLTNASLVSGNLYRSPFFSPFQAALALQYRSRWGFRINPVVTYDAGYPYGVGTLTQVLINGKLVTVPYTNAIAQGSLPSTGGVGGTPYYYVDPQNPGTLTNPVVVATNGLSEGPSAGSLLSQPSFNTDLTIEFGVPHKSAVYGLTLTNLFDQLYSVPVPNPRYDRLCNYNPIATGIASGGVGSNPGNTCINALNMNPIINGSPAQYDDPYGGRQPYLVLPNRQPFAARVYLQLPL